jgi:hypothetical protein
MSVKITGLDGLVKDLEDAKKAFASLDGTIAELSFSPNDLQSVQAAITKMEAAIDEKTNRYRSNHLVMQVANSLKETYRKAILEKKAENQE